MTKPPWEFHILNVKTSDAEGVAIFKLHHSIGDGVSLMALVHACSRRISDPESLPIMPLPNKRKRDKSGLLRGLFVFVWTVFAVVMYTLVDGVMFLATLTFLKDAETPIKANAGGVKLTCKRFVHRIVNLDDVKLVKTAMNAVMF